MEHPQNPNFTAPFADISRHCRACLLTFITDLASCDDYLPSGTSFQNGLEIMKIPYANDITIRGLLRNESTIEHQPSIPLY